MWNSRQTGLCEGHNPGVVLPHDFIFLWLRGGQFVIGRAWPSRDTSGRAYPMFAVAHGIRLPLDWAVGRAKRDFVGKRSLDRPDMTAAGRRL